MDIWLIGFIVYMGLSLGIGIIGFTRRGNPDFVGRWLAHRRMGHRHTARKSSKREIEKDE